MTEAVAAEANQDPTLAVRWRELEFTIPRDRDEWSFEAGLAFEQGKFLTAITELLSDEDLGKFRATKPKNRDAADLIKVIANALGFDDAGESPASSD